MKFLLSLVFCLFATVSSNANAWFFFFPIPNLSGGSATSDNSCVAETTKEGDTFNNANGNIAKVTKLSGTSNKCKDPAMPILATVDYTSSINFSSKAGIELPEKYKSMNLTPRQQYFEGILLKAKTDDGKLFIQLISLKRSIITSMPEYVKKYQDGLKNLDEPTFSEIEELSFDGFPAWQFEQKGKLKNLFGSRMTILHTIIESDEEVILIQSWGYDIEYADEKETFMKLPFGIKGLTLPIHAASQTSKSNVATPGGSLKNGSAPLTRKSAALITAQEIVADNPDKANSWENLGTVHLSEKNYAKAVSSFEEAIKRNPKSIDAIYGLGSAYNGLGNKDKVQETYFRLKKADPTKAAAYFKEYLLP